MDNTVLDTGDDGYGPAQTTTPDAVSGGNTPSFFDRIASKLNPIFNPNTNLNPSVFNTPNANNGVPSVTFTGSAASGTDWRLKIKYAGTALAYAGIMQPLATTGGVIFPHTPSLTVQETATYGTQKLTHSNYAQYFYEGSEVPAISISGEFTVQNTSEGAYLLAAIYFFRSATKMFFGTGNNVGNPPPVLKLNGYGSSYLSDVPCVLTSFSHTMPQEVDYIDIGGPYATRVPTISTIQISVQPIYSRSSQRQWNLSDFSQGKLITGKGFL